ncbi:16S rRNA (cytosine(1402)-N(4))-methyltransferase RsmH [Amnibacterium sp.]|uniref:16S rRNA (cytosine(1402)-N(4))-methyltransferase RsmH n=1 Tax=Amnibacterium sp. TaxID=1872496 RepID=UPI002624309A|nr:16S rRNA (cytosine(1402)-N(4))-methyltransferase RsmH [Amnibacterium sp.]MCU1475287.1 rRNA ((1402)-N(4))-methyltransferase [Amnibacterium sp.]
MSTALHVPVLLEPVLELLAPALDHDGAVAVDATLGLGGHTGALLDRFPGLTVVGVDRDPTALDLAGERLAAFGPRFRPVHAVYDRIPDVLDELGIRFVDGVLFDLGVSSMQLDRDDRGFSYARDTALDMRMDPDEPRTAADVLATFSEGELTRIFRVYGEERLAARYARAIVAARAATPLTRSAELVAVLDAATPAALRSAGHPAKRVFQALRIEVNRELEVLERAVPAALDVLAIHGRIVVLSYHSLEDRIVKRAITARTVSTAPRGLPVEPEETAPTFRMLTRGAPGAAPAEVERNPRAASVRLRSATRVRGNA